MCAMRLESCSGFCCGPGAAVEGVVVVPPVVDVVAVVVVVVELVEELVVSVEADAAVVVATVFVVGVDPPIGKDPGFTPGKSEGAVLWRVLSPCCICITAFNAWGLDSKACISGFCSCCIIVGSCCITCC